jgi:class 3 adenylate cyclase/tetratricopeptide (TPR) repeat protein
VTEQTNPTELLTPYLPRLLVQWLAEDPASILREIDGSVVFVDISGFTKMSERLARKGKVGAEEVTEVLGSVFAQLLAIAYGNGGGLLKFGGDALLLFFSGEGHPTRAVRSAFGMRRTLRSIGRLETSAGLITLRMSVGVHRGVFQFFLVGDSHREFMITGPAASTTVDMEGTASAGEILLSAALASEMPDSILGAAKGEGVLLRRDPAGLASAPAEASIRTAGLDLSRCIPVAIRDHLLSGAVDPEHRQVTVAFIHFDGVDEMVRTRGAQAVAEALHALVCSVQAAADRRSVTFLGTDVDHDGGKIILVAGTPQAVGEDEERMLLAVRDVVESNPPIPVRIGVNEGPVFTGDIGPSYRRTYTVMGDAVNLAARVMAKAEPGQALATSGVLGASSVAFETAALEPFMVKGKKRPVEAFILGGAIGAKKVEADELPLVGRAAELRAFREAVDGARGGSGSVLEIVGEPGIGKTRLLHELGTRAAGLQQLAAACEPYEMSTPYFPFRRLLRTALGLTEDADERGAAEALRRCVEALAPELAPWLPLLAIPLDVEVGSTPEVDELAQEFRRARLEEATETFLSRLLHEPTLATIEDVHWMDEGSASLLGRLGRVVHERPWVLAVTRRDEETGFVAPEGRDIVSLRPEPLGESEAEELVTEATEASPLRPHEVTELAERSGGNPLFLKELVAAVGQTGTLEGLPGSIEATVTAQIDRLPPRDRRLLRYASVLGASFGDDLVALMLEGEDESLDPAAWRRLGEFVAEDGTGLHRFRHALMRDAAYEGLPYRRRRELHARVGEALERGADDLEDVCELLSLHYFNAGRFEEAWRYSRMAGDLAREIFANVEAAGFYQRAVDAARDTRDVPAKDLAEVAEALGDAREKVGAFDRAAVAYRFARKLRSGDPVGEAALLYKESWIPERSGSYPQAVRWIMRGLRTLEGVESVEAARLRAKLRGWLGSVRLMQGRLGEAISCSAAAIAEAEAAGDDSVIADACVILDAAYVERGELSKAVYSKRAAEMHEASGDLAGQGLVYNNMGAFAYYEGKWDEAIALYERGRDARARTGDAVMAALGDLNIGEILMDQGRLDEARAMFEHALRVWRAADFRSGIADALCFLGRAASRSGDCDEAERLFAETAAMAEEIGSRSTTIEAEAGLAENALLQGDGGRALASATRWLADPEVRSGVAAERVNFHRIRGYALLQLGELDTAREALETSVAASRELGAEFEVGLSLEGLVRLSWIRGEPGPRDQWDQAEEIFNRLGVIARPVVPIAPEIIERARASPV